MDRKVIINRHELELTNLEKIFWQDEKYTKGDLIQYYRSVSKFILPYIKDKPQSLNRFPNGIDGQSFFQKNIKNKIADWLTTVEVYSESNRKKLNYLVCKDEASLIYMVNLGCIEINPWFSTIKHPEKPDYLSIDLDPLNVDFEKVIITAKAVKEVLDKAKAPGFCKTSGATGIHIYIPLGAKYKFEEVREFAHTIAKMTNLLLPKITSLERAPSKRNKKVYIDYLQNSIGQTMAAPYSVRPKPKATVSTPLEWDELDSLESPQEFTIRTIHSRLKEKGDLFKGTLGKGIDIERCKKNLGVDDSK